MGVLLYVLLSGCPPFYGETSKEIIKSIEVGEYNFELDEFNDVSDSCKHLIGKMICPRNERFDS